MKNMINKNTILGLIVGIIISGVTVYAVTYEANTINYTTSKNNEVKTVKDALDDLYKNKTITFGDTSATYSAGVRIPTRTVTKELTKGKYIVSVVGGFGAYWGLGTNNFKDISRKPTCSNEDDCEISELKTVEITQKSTEADIYLDVTHGIYYVEVLSNNTILNYSYNLGNSENSHATILNLEVSKIN